MNNILIIDDHFSIAESIGDAIVRRRSNSNKISTAKNFFDSKTILKKEGENIQLVILDLSFETKDYTGIDIALYIREHYPNIKIIIYSTIIKKVIYNFLINEVNIDGFVNKSSSILTLLDAIKAVELNKHYIDKSIKTIIENDPFGVLAPALLETLDLLASGLSTKQVAEIRGVKKSSLEGQIKKITRDLHCSKIEAILNYQRFNLNTKDDYIDTIPDFLKNIKS